MLLRRSDPRLWLGLTAAGLCLLAGALAGDLRLSDAGAAWAGIAVVVAATGGVLVWAARRGRLLEPLPALSFVVLVVLGLRPAQLLADRGDVLVYQRPTTSVGSLIGLSSQEIAYFVDRKLVLPLDVALREAVLLCALFVVLTGLGFALTPVKRLATGVRRATAWTAAADMRPVVVGFALVGLAGQAAIYVRIGGPGAALGSILDQSNLAAGFAFFAAANFAPVALLLWLAWHPPTATQSRVALVLATLEVVVFYTTLGSRALALYPALMLLVVFHYRVRRLGLRPLLAVLGAVLLLASAYLGVRQATYSQSGSAALRSGSSYLVNPSAIGNDNSAFDNLLQARVTIGDAVPFRHGRSLTDAVTQFVPGAVWAGKPESTDIWFRKAVWGERFLGGRPYTLVGELWADFGLAGVVLGSMLFGVLLRYATALVPRRGDDAPLPAVVLAVTIVSLYVWLVGVHTIAAAFAIQYLVPVALALALARRKVVARP